MKALFLNEPGCLEFKDVPKPELTADEDSAIVKVLACSVCGSDYHSYHGGNPLITYPRIMGHEVCGIVESVNSNTAGLQKGDKVILMPYLSCGHCIACRKGRSTCCSSLSVYGVHHDGAFTEYFKAPVSSLIKVDQSLDPSVAALIEPLSISTHAVFRANVKKGDIVLVAGAGPIGLGAALISRADGAKVIIADTNQVRRTFVEKEFGFDLVLDPLASDYKDSINKLTNDEGPDIIIDSTGSNISMANNVYYLSNGGRLVFVGISNKPISLDGTVFHKKETELFDSRAATREDFLKVIKYMESGVINPRPMITNKCMFSDSKSSFEEWAESGGKVFKAVILMEK